MVPVSNDIIAIGQAGQIQRRGVMRGIVGFDLEFDFGGNLAAIQRVLREMYDACTRGVAINFLSITDPQTDPIFYHYDPQVMLAYCQTFCPDVRVREDYLPNDFTLYLYRATLS